jgi:hypothetical protein
MQSTKVCILEDTNKISLSRLLKGKHSRSLEAEGSLQEVLSDLAHKFLEGNLGNKEIA